MLSGHEAGQERLSLDEGKRSWRDNYTVCFKFNDSETQRVYETKHSEWSKCYTVLFCFVFFNEELTTPRVSFYPDVFLCLLISFEKEGQRNSRNIQFRQLPSRPQALYIIGKSKCALIKYVRWLWGKHHAAGKIQVHLIQNKENVFKGHANPRSFFVINRLAFCGKSNWLMSKQLTGCHCVKTKIWGTNQKSHPSWLLSISSYVYVLVSVWFWCFGKQLHCIFVKKRLEK